MNLLESLRTGMSRALDLWRDRLGGADDSLYWVLRLELGDAGDARPMAPSLMERVGKAHREIASYFDNVRYLLLDPTTKAWGTLTNALRVAAGVDSVTDAQRQSFSFPPESAAKFVRAAHHDPSLAGALAEAFKPMPAADCQTLAALFNINLDATVDAATVIAIVRLFGNEGPLTQEESVAFSVLRNTGLVGAAFHGTRGQG